MILEFIEKYGKATKSDIDNLLMEILPSVLNDKKKANKVRNIIYAMSKKDMTIINQGTRKNPEWIKV